MAEDTETVKLLKEYGASLATLQSDLAAAKGKADQDVPALRSEVEALKVKIEELLKKPAAAESFKSDWEAFWQGLFGE